MNWLNSLLQGTASAKPSIWHESIATLAAQFKAQQIQSVALWFEQGSVWEWALLAAWQAGADVLLLPNQNDAAIAWAKQADVLLSDVAMPHQQNWLLADKLAQKQPAPLIQAIKKCRLLGHEKLFLQTSGSTGEPKIIAKTATQMCAEADAIADTFPASWHGAQVLTSVSPQHMYGLTFRVFAALRLNWQVQDDTCIYPEDFIAQTKQPCLWLTSPAVLTHFHDKRDWQTWASRVQGIISAGGLLPDATVQRFQQQAQLAITNVYGSTETGVIAHQNHTTHHQLFPNVQARLNSEQQLCIQSPWTNGEQTLADTATISGDTLLLHGRSDRIIKLGDKRIALHQIEHALLTHDTVADVHCAVHKGRVAAWISLSAQGVAWLRQNGRAALLDIWRTFLIGKVEKVALPRFWRLTAQPLPRNAQAKIRAADMQQVLDHPIVRPDWQLVAQTESEWQFAGCIPVDLRYFQGHFATFPLVAGVVQLQWAMELASQFDWGRAPVIQMENIKYQQFIRPNDVVNLTLRWDSDKHKIHFALSVEGKTCASGRAVVQAAL